MGLGIIGLSDGTLRPGNFFRSLDRNILIAALVIRSIVTEEVRGARAGSTQALAARIFNDWIAKDATFKCVLCTHISTTILRSTEGLAGECVACTLVRTPTIALCRSLDSAAALVFVLKDVGVLVGCSSGLCLQRFVSSEEVVSLIVAALAFLAVGLVVKSVASHVVIETGLPIVIHNILVWMAQHIGAVLSLLQGSGFCHLCLTED